MLVAVVQQLSAPHGMGALFLLDTSTPLQTFLLGKTAAKSVKKIAIARLHNISSMNILIPDFSVMNYEEENSRLEYLG